MARGRRDDIGSCSATGRAWSTIAARSSMRPTPASTAWGRTVSISTGCGTRANGGASMSARRLPRRFESSKQTESCIRSDLDQPAGHKTCLRLRLPRQRLMSEYQYYEFQAIDRPLSEADRQALRRLSTRARITATSFTNSYEWGDFKGDPAKLMERWFDLHLYLANWGSRRLMIKLPKRLVDRRLLDAFLGKVDCATLSASGENLIVDISCDEVESE